MRIKNQLGCWLEPLTRSGRLYSAKKKKSNCWTRLGLGLRPNPPNLLWVKGMFGKNTPSCLSPFVLKSNQTSHLGITKNSKNIRRSTLIYLWVPYTFFFFCFVVYLICGLYFEIRIWYAIHTCLFLKKRIIKICFCS